MSRTNNSLKWAIAAVIVALIAGFLIFRNKHTDNHNAEDTKPVSVEIITITEQNIPEIVWASGSIAPIAQANITPKIMSTVAAVYVKEGDRVKKGQLLMKLEASDLAAQTAAASASVNSAKAMNEKANTAIKLQYAQTKANIANAEAALQIARQQLSAAKEGPRKQEKSQAELAVIQAEAQYRNAETELARMTNLYNQGVIPKQKLDSVQTQYDIAKAQLGIAKQQADISQEGTRAQDIKAAEERVKQAENALRLAKIAAVQNEMVRKEAQAASAMVSQSKAAYNTSKVMQGYATLVSPISGIVTARFVDPGDMASPGVPVLVIEDDSQYRLEASVALKNSNEISIGMNVGVEIGAEKRKGTGKVSMIVPAGDAYSHKYTVKIDIPKSLNPISGEFGKAMFAVGYSKGILIPESAIYDNDGICNVFIADPDNRTNLSIVRVGKRIDGKAEIITGLKHGDRLITKSSKPLIDDIPITVRRTNYEK